MELDSQTAYQLEFRTILDEVTQYCKGSFALSQIQNPTSEASDLGSIEKTLLRVEELTLMMDQGELFDLYAYEDIVEDLYLLGKNGYVLEVESIQKILLILRNYNNFNKHFTKGRINLYPSVYEMGRLETYDDSPIKKILKVLDSEGNVRPDASPELLRINKKITGISRQVDRQFEELLAKGKKSGLLSDSAESIRNGRRVLVLPVENKRKIEGVIHDQSGSGKTVYIEPQEMMVLNNELYSLENDYRAEIYRVLRTLCEDLRADRDLISQCFTKTVDLDVHLAKAKFSKSINGVRPALEKRPLLNLMNVHHPILLLKEIKGGDKTIPFDLVLKGDNRILLISGPNAGGKSVTLKAIGLIHLMIYNGLLVPVDKDSKIGLFNKIFVDIGDQQSINEGLSTYSSHLSNLSAILNQADPSTLILLDEIGSGTDPKLGGAIAEGIIRGLIAKKAYGVITTHYSELKVFAFRQKGILNGAMLFDKENLKPTYKLKVGKPGSSYAFEVAKKVGIDERVLKYARKKVGKKENQIEDLLVDLQEGKAILDEQLEWLEKERTQLDKLIKNYEQLSNEFQVKRKKLQIRAKELEYKKANDENLQLQNLINKLEKEKNLEKAKKKKKEAIEKRSSESTEILELKKEIIAEKREDEVIVVGDYVKMIDGDMSGEVLSIKGERAKVLFGLMQMDVNLADVTLANAQLEFNRNKNINVKGVAFQANFSPKIDIRGYKLDDAAYTLDEFFDKALLNDVRMLEIVHGKGKGALRKLVISKIKEYNDFQSYYHPADEQGGDGVTMVRM